MIQYIFKTIYSLYIKLLVFIYEFRCEDKIKYIMANNKNYFSLQFLLKNIFLYIYTSLICLKELEFAYFTYLGFPFPNFFLICLLFDKNISRRFIYIIHLFNIFRKYIKSFRMIRIVSVFPIF